MNNLCLKSFLAKVVVSSIPEDERDSVYFEFKEWVDFKFSGIPPTEVQRLVDQTIPVWLNNFNNAKEFVKKLCEIQLKELGIRSAVIAARYSVEKCWKNKQDTRPIKAVELVEKWLEDENSVTAKQLNSLATAAIDAALNEEETTGDANSETVNAADAASGAAFAAYVEKYTLLYHLKHDPERIKVDIEDSVENAIAATSDKEVCKVVAEKLQRFYYEDLLQWRYFQIT